MRPDTNIVIQILLAVFTLVMGLLLTIKPEKMQWTANPTKLNILVARILGIIILALLAFALVTFIIGVCEGQIVL